MKNPLRTCPSKTTTVSSTRPATASRSRARPERITPRTRRQASPQCRRPSDRRPAVTRHSTVLALGAWPREQVEARWLEERYEPPDEVEKLADDAVEELRRRGSPSHDGLAARLAGYESLPQRLALELQPSRWSLRLLDGDASYSLATVCIVRSADGRWLAGRRAAWLATWAKRWALGAGGAVDVGENPADTLVREL